MHSVNSDIMTLWKQMIASVRKQGHEFKEDRNGTELLNVMATLTNTEHITYPIEYLGQCKDWIYPSVREVEDIILGKSSQQSYTYAYGSRIFGNGANNANQMHDFIIPLLKQNPGSRRASLIVALPQDVNLHSMNSMPSVLVIDFKLREGKLHSTMFIRSSDVFIGWPANIYQLYVLTDYVAARIDAKVGSLTTVAASAHLFTEYNDAVQRLLNR